METLGSIYFWLNFHLFIIAFIFSCFIPGLVVLRRIKFNDYSSKLIISTVLGIVMWSAQGYLFGYLNLRFLSLTYILLFTYLFYKNRSEIIDSIYGASEELKNLNKYILATVLIGTIIQIIPVIGSGLRYKSGLRFFGVNGYDGMMHLGFIQSITQYFPPREPGAVGNLITNYHYWSDLFVAEIVRVWHLPISNTFFQYTPPIISILTAFALYKLIKIFTSDTRILIIGLIFLYLAGDAAYIFMLILHLKFGFYTPAIDNGVTQFLNLPHSMAKMIFLTGLLTFQYWIKSKNKIHGYITIILFASLTGFKVYFALYCIIGLFSLILSSFFYSWFRKNRIELNYLPNLVKAIKEIIPLLGFTLLFITLFLIIFLPPNRGSGGLFYSPLEWSKILLSSSAIDFQAWWYWYNRFTTSRNNVGLILLNTIAIFITLIAIHGTRVLGFFIGKKSYKLIGFENIAFILPPLIIFQILGLTTLQISGGLNVFNFFAVSTTVLALFTTLKIAEILHTKIKFAYSITVLIIILTIPRGMYEVYTYLSSYVQDKNGYTISNDELNALNYIRENSPSSTVIQSSPLNGVDNSVPYTSYFSNRFSYLSGVKLQETHNQPIKERQADLALLFNSPNSFDFLKGLEKRGIGLFYIQKNFKEQFMPFTLTEGHFKVFYENESIIVYDPIEGL